MYNNSVHFTVYFNATFLPECRFLFLSRFWVSQCVSPSLFLRVCVLDVKPSNVLINMQGQVKMCDFGISGYLVDSVAKTMDAGCKPYMAVRLGNFLYRGSLWCWSVLLEMDNMIWFGSFCCQIMESLTGMLFGRVIWVLWFHVWSGMSVVIMASVFFFYIYLYIFPT